MADAVAVAWLGRTSTDDAQDPTLSLPRQLRKSQAALPDNCTIVAHYFDVESGRKELEQRGRGGQHQWFDISIPRDGGIQDLLVAAARPDRPFTAVICESIERVARRTYFGTKVEYELERCGVALWAADEPFSTTPRGARATPILTRRVKQAVAEWFVLQLLELSWDGTVEHTRQGWNIGKPPYGYLAEKVPHPVPAKRAEGHTKHRLVPHPVQGPVVARIFQLRVGSRLGYDRIADRLNLDLEANPPPQPTRAGEGLGRWSATAVRDVLLNPKYTGYMVYNRRARKNGNRANPPSEWVWSPQPVHEPLVTRELYDAAAAARPRRDPVARNRTLPNPPQNTYPLRSYLRCALCGRRIWGKTQPGGLVYYLCVKDRRQHADRPWFEHHPDTVRVRATTIEPLVDQFLAAHGAAAQSCTPATFSTEGLSAASSTGTEHTAALRRRQRRLIAELELLGESELPSGELAALRSAIYRRFLDLEAQLNAHRGRVETPQLSAAERTLRVGSSASPAPRCWSADGQQGIYAEFGLDARYDQIAKTLTVTAVLNDAVATTTYLLEGRSAGLR